MIDDAQCPGCPRCITTCKAKALQVENVCRGVDRVVAICPQGHDFYEESQGDVIFSGEEALAQPLPAKALVLRLEQEGTHVAVEATGYIQSAISQKLAPLPGLLLSDTKRYGTEQHVLRTGVDNDLIPEDLAQSVKHQFCALPCIPIIPGCNASLQDAKGLAALLTSLSIQRIQLLPFHQLGEKKYEILNHDYEMKYKKVLHPEDLRDHQ